MAIDYETILKGRYPAKSHAKKVVEYIHSKIPDATGVLYLESRASKLHEDSDQEEHFRYELNSWKLVSCCPIVISVTDFNVTFADNGDISTI